MREITLQIKAKIFALYYGQDIAYIPSTWRKSVSEALQKGLNDQDALEVKPLELITDEDAIEVAKIHFSYNPAYYITDTELREDMKKEGVGLVGKIGINGYGFYPDTLSESIDFLRSRDYALPAYGFSVDKLIAAGVFKLKQ